MGDGAWTNSDAHHFDLTEVPSSAAIDHSTDISAQYLFRGPGVYIVGGSPTYRSAGLNSTMNARGTSTAAAAGLSGVVMVSWVPPAKGAEIVPTLHVMCTHDALVSIDPEILVYAMSAIGGRSARQYEVHGVHGVAVSPDQDGEGDVSMQLLAGETVVVKGAASPRVA